jgi:hypothetical protein
MLNKCNGRCLTGPNSSTNVSKSSHEFGNLCWLKSAFLGITPSLLPFFYRQTAPVLLFVSRTKTPVIGDFCPQNEPVENLKTSGK